MTNTGFFFAQDHLSANHELISAQRRRHTELITQLKGQLEELESYAYESGEADSLPSNLLLERQRLVMDSLKTRYEPQFTGVQSSLKEGEIEGSAPPLPKLSFLRKLVHTNGIKPSISI